MAAKTHPVPNAKDKKAMQDAIIQKMRAVDLAAAELVKLKNALGAQFAEVGNSDKMNYTDRDTGQVQKWGISDAVMKREDGVIKAALAAAKEYLKTL